MLANEECPRAYYLPVLCLRANDGEKLNTQGRRIACKRVRLRVPGRLYLSLLFVPRLTRVPVRSVRSRVFLDRFFMRPLI